MFGVLGTRCYDSDREIPADMAELVDALDLGSSFSRSEGSSPFVRICFNKPCSLKPTF
jgi:hypothetical protein